MKTSSTLEKRKKRRKIVHIASDFIVVFHCISLANYFTLLSVSLLYECGKETGEGCRKRKITKFLVFTTYFSTQAKKVKVFRDVLLSVPR